MKKTVFFLILIGMASAVFGASLGTEASALKATVPSAYLTIRTRAISEWGSDAYRVVDTINRQAEGLMKTGRLLSVDSSITLRAIAEWTDGGLDALTTALESGDKKDFFSLPTDWQMAASTAENRIVATEVH